MSLSPLDSVYLDHAGATLYAQSQIKEVAHDLLSNCYSNPHSQSPSSRLTHDLIDQTRADILNFFNADPTVYSLIFTSGATASLKLVAESFQFKLPSENLNEHSGSFVYIKESHTSVVGMRKYTLENNIATYALPSDDANQTVHCDQKELIRSHANNSKFSKSLKNCSIECNSLFSLPAQCNFSGYKYPMEWIAHSQSGIFSNVSDKFCLNQDAIREQTRSRWFCLLDAASFASTNMLDLSKIRPDFVALSFYKIMGFPTGIGALLVHKRALETLSKDHYFGGGSVEMYSTTRNINVNRRKLHERFEDGTVNFLSILHIRHGLKALRSSITTMEHVSIHTYSLAKYLYDLLVQLKHNNGNSLAEIYSESDYSNRQQQGGIVSFNLRSSDGHYLGYAQVYFNVC